MINTTREDRETICTLNKALALLYPEAVQRDAEPIREGLRLLAIKEKLDGGFKSWLKAQPTLSASSGSPQRNMRLATGFLYSTQGAPWLTLTPSAVLHTLTTDSSLHSAIFAYADARLDQRLTRLHFHTAKAL